MLGNITRILIRHSPFFIVAAIIVFTIYPSLSFILPPEIYIELKTLIGQFHRPISIINIPLKYYLTPYGFNLASIALAYQIFGLNAQNYYILNLILKIAAAFSIYYVGYYWTKRKTIGLLSGLFFGISFPGIQTTTWVSLFITYILIILMFLFLLVWKKFHEKPTKMLLIISVLLFFLSFFIYPYRAVSLLVIVLLGETYYLLSKNFLLKSQQKIKILHAVLLVTAFVFILFGTSKLRATPDLAGTMISPLILIRSLLTGFPPLIYSLWLFIGNLFLSPLIITHLLRNRFNLLNESILYSITIFLTLTASLTTIHFLFKRKFLIALLSIAAVIFPYFLFTAKTLLVGWDISWLVATQVGEVMLITSILTIFYLWGRNRKIAEYEIIGILFIIPNLIIPWMAAPAKTFQDQSAFSMFHRYYSLPSIGMGIIWATIVSIFGPLAFTNLKSIFKPTKNTLIHFFKKIYFSVVSFFSFSVVMAIFIVYLLNIVTVRSYLINLQTNVDKRVYILWNNINPYFESLKNRNELRVVYLDTDLSTSNLFISEIFPFWISIKYAHISDQPGFNFVFDKTTLTSLMGDKKNSTDNLYAFEFKNNQLKDIKKSLLEEMQNAH